MKIVLFLSVIIFFFFASLQFNDPDPLVWVLAYSACGGLSILVLNKKNVLLSASVMTFIYAIWLGVLLSQTTGAWWEGEIEREAGGIGLCMAWCLALSLRAKYFSP